MFEADRTDHLGAGLAASLDGFIAGTDDDISWLDPYPATDVGYDQFIAGIDGLVMGRRTYEVVMGFGPWPHGSRPTAVATGRPLDNPPDAVFAVNGTPAEMLAGLRSRGAEGRIWLEGGGNLAGQFLKAGLIDTLEIGLIPVLLGEGVSLFGGTAFPRLQLQWAKGLPSGIVHTLYKVRG